ncbi:MAG: hypothetical protein MI725_10920, partial [Pirellulales bacterium]|nr:hypothetical protein [Pirellulales bacterium]
MNRLLGFRRGGVLLPALFVSLALLLSFLGVATPAMGQTCGCAEGCDAEICCDCGTSCCCCSPWQHCTGAWGEFLYLQATGADLAHAQQQNGTGGAGTTPFGLIGVADPDYEPGFGVGVNCALTRCSSLAASYEHYESNTFHLLPIGAAPGNTIGSLVQHPGAGTISSAGPLNAAYDIDYQLVDIKYRRLLFGDNCGWMNYSVGAKYGHLDQDFLQTGT